MTDQTEKEKLRQEIFDLKFQLQLVIRDEVKYAELRKKLTEVERKYRKLLLEEIEELENVKGMRKR